MYIINHTERNNDIATEYETKSLLYLCADRQDSEEIEIFFVDCFNDVTGSNATNEILWDVQSKGYKSISPKKIGQFMITLYNNYLSDIEFAHYILFVKVIDDNYIINTKLKNFGIDNFKQPIQEKIKNGLLEKYKSERGNDIDPNNLREFLDKVQIVISSQSKIDYIKNVTAFKNDKLNDKFYEEIFEEIRGAQSNLKIKNIEGKVINETDDLLIFKKYLKKKDIDLMIISRFIGMDLFNYQSINKNFWGEIKNKDIEEVEDILQQCNSELSKLIFDKTGRKIFWRFFERILSYKEEIINDTPRNVYNIIKKNGTRVPRLLSEISVIYLIALIKGGISNVD